MIFGLVKKVLVAGICKFPNFCALFRGQYSGDSEVIGIFILLQLIIGSESHMAANKMVLVIDKHGIKVILGDLLLGVRTRELLMLKVDLAVTSVPCFEQQRVWGQPKIWLQVCIGKSCSPVVIDVVLVHLGLETLFDHWCSVLELMKKPFMVLMSTM